MHRLFTDLFPVVFVMWLVFVKYWNYLNFLLCCKAIYRYYVWNDVTYVSTNIDSAGQNYRVLGFCQFQVWSATVRSIRGAIFQSWNYSDWLFCWHCVINIFLCLVLQTVDLPEGWPGNPTDCSGKRKTICRRRYGENLIRASAERGRTMCRERTVDWGRLFYFWY